MATKVKVEDKGRTVYGEYHGGPYIELSFGKPGKPTEVINVWDYEAERPGIENTEASVRREIEEWINERDREYPEWYDDYITYGNPSEGNYVGAVPLHQVLSTLAQHVDYEAEVVEEAAAKITDPEIKAAAKRQVEGMNEAAEALDKAAESAAETAAEVYVETGVPSEQTSEPVVVGNPSKFYRMGYELGKDRLAEAGGDPDQVREPLSGEFAGESISEILGEDFDDDEEMEAAADDFEAGYWAAVYGNPGVPVVSDVAKATGKALDTTAEAITPEVVQREIRESVAEDIAPEPTDWLFRPRFRKHG